MDRAWGTVKSEPTGYTSSGVPIYVNTLCRALGFDPNDMKRLLTGKADIPFAKAAMVADYLGISLDELWQFVAHRRGLREAQDRASLDPKRLRRKPNRGV